jgi:protein gp37
MENSKISWTTHTFNPWVGCTRVSPGCAHCYAEALARRTGFAKWRPGQARRVTSEAYWRKPKKWAGEAARTGDRPRVFCASLADVFDEEAPIDARRRLWRVIADTSEWLDWLLLTKRPERINRTLDADAIPGDFLMQCWVGTTVENQGFADRRIPELKRVRAGVRFLSAEPLLDRISMHDHFERGYMHGRGRKERHSMLPGCCGIDWVIAGAESGPGARPMDERWVRSLRDECVEAGVKFFYKQRIEDGRKVELPELDGKVWDEVPGSASLFAPAPAGGAR